MLFSSFPFIFYFLPCAILAAAVASFLPYSVYLSVLVIASAVFYYWHVPVYLALLAGSAFFNFCLASFVENNNRRWLCAIGVAANICLLAYFKYQNFFIQNIDNIGGFGIAPRNLVLPLAISFITFEQIAFLSSVHTKKIARGSLLQYLAFITFFPKLIAGPIIRYTELLPQLKARKAISLNSLATGICIFSIGLFKKVALADQISPVVNAVYDAARSNVVPAADATWATFAYAAQIYFDFSGYSDMAIGLAWMFGLTLPINFLSPYKATSLIDFWRRWHITLSRFLRDYLYIPLGGSRGPQSRTYVNLLLVMTLGGLWHGAGWTFVVWGAIHGVALIINHIWNIVAAKGHATAEFFGGPINGLLTMLVVLLGWVFFRAADLHAATNIFRSLAGGWTTTSIDRESMKLILAAWTIILIGPNTAQIFNYRFLLTGTDNNFLISIPPVPVRKVVFAGIAFVASMVVMASGQVNAFIYFQF